MAGSEGKKGPLAGYKDVRAVSKDDMKSKIKSIWLYYTILKALPNYSK